MISKKESVSTLWMIFLLLFNYYMYYVNDLMLFFMNYSKDLKIIRNISLSIKSIKVIGVFLRMKLPNLNNTKKK
jgi:hypothetical protein